jgi:CheY-like chemotaxis protein
MLRGGDLCRILVREVRAAGILLLSRHARGGAMATQEEKVRVIVAAERPEAREILINMAQDMDDAVVVGEAGNATSAIGLARDVRPDVVLIDTYLPHGVGFDGIRLSRIGGLDTAQSISAELPETKVVLLNNLEANGIAGRRLMSQATIFPTDSTTTPLRLGELHRDTAHPSPIVFAYAQAMPWETTGQKGTWIEKVLFFGGLGVFVGLCMIITFVLAPVGLFVTLAGVATVLLGLGARLFSKVRHKVAHQTT